MVSVPSCSRPFLLALAALWGCSETFTIEPDARVTPPDAGVEQDRGTPLPDAGDAGITPGNRERLLLRGTIVTPDSVIAEGEVLTDKNTIVCVAQSCADQPAAADATVIDTAGIIYPGLIDAHNHTEFNYQPVWQAPKTYANHNQWASSVDYDGTVSGPHGDLKNPDGTDGSGACSQPSDCTTGICLANKCESLLCEMIKYGEIRAMISGATTILQTALRKCANTLIRNADLPYHGLSGGDSVRTSALGTDSISNPAKLVDDLKSGAVRSFFIHVAEGTDENARKEFDELEALGLLLPGVSIIHGTALGEPELTKVKQAGMSLIWSPSSNLALYGQTNDIALAWNLGIPIALGPDFTPAGAPNQLEELRAAKALNDGALGGLFSAKDMVRMVTSVPAAALGFEAEIGALAPGMRADLLVVAGDRNHPYDALIDARLPQVRMVVVDGKPLYGDAALITELAPNAYCETVTVCGAGKMLCVKEQDSPTDKLDQSFGDISSRLEQAYPKLYTLSTCD